MNTTPAHKAAAKPPVGPLGQWLADLGLGYVLMLCASIGGLAWLVAIHLAGMRHDAALLLSLEVGIGVFALVNRLAVRADAAARAKTGPRAP